MDTPTSPEPATSPLPVHGPAPTWSPSYDVVPAPAPRRRARWRGVAAVALAGALLATGVGVGAAVGSAHAQRVDSATTSPTTGSGGPDGSATTAEQLPDPGTSGSGAFGGPEGFAGDPAQQGQSTGTDATDEQSQGLVLIDTVLPDGEAAGTGMILDEDGTVLTNYHVVEGSTSITVTDAVSGTTYEATVVGHDATADVALLQLQDATDLTPVTLDDDGDPSVADAVTAVGNAEGQGYLSASSGTVQALAQSITTSSSAVADGESLTDLIKTDAYVVGGYSGGALLDAEGEVVGITTAASSSTRVAESYAVPIQDALAVVSQIESGTETTEVAVGASAYLGVQVDDSLLLAGVEDGSPAADAGLAAGDTLTALDGTALATRTDLTDVLAGHEPGDTVGVSWTDGTGATHRGTITLGSSPVN